MPSTALLTCRSLGKGVKKSKEDGYIRYVHRFAEKGIQSPNQYDDAISTP